MAYDNDSEEHTADETRHHHHRPERLAARRACPRGSAPPDRLRLSPIRDARSHARPGEPRPRGRSARPGPEAVAAGQLHRIDRGPDRRPRLPRSQGPGADAPAPFKKICGVATDRLGYVYVSGGLQALTEWFIQVFNPKGLFVTKFPVPGGGCRIAVDSQGRIYQAGSTRRYTPSSYPPTKATTYAAAGIEEAEGVAVDPNNDNYYVASAASPSTSPTANRTASARSRRSRLTRPAAASTSSTRAARSPPPAT